MNLNNVAIITPGVLPIPSTKGGAVENLIESYLQENEKMGTCQFHVYSIYEKEAKKKSTQYKYATFHFYHPNKLLTRIQSFFYRKIQRQYYYNPYMDFYGNWAIHQIKKIKTALIIIENRQGFILNPSLKPNCPIVLHLHNDTLNTHADYAREILNRFDKIITVSNYIKKQVDSIANNDKTEVIYNGIDIETFSSPELIYSRKDFKLDTNDFVVLYTGRISPIKGIRELLQAFCLLKNYPTIKLLIVGSSNFGENTKDTFFNEMKELAQTAEKQIIFTGYIPYKNIPSILKLADIGIIPSTCEDALTLSSLEGMAAGLPLIVTRSGGIPEAVSERCAIIVEKDEHLISSLAHSIKLLYNNKALKDSMSKESVARSKLFSKKNYVHGMLTMIKSITK